jgi:hypothetical protein
VAVNHELRLPKRDSFIACEYFLPSRSETALYVRFNRSPISIQAFVREIDIDASAPVVTSQRRFPPEVWAFVCWVIVRFPDTQRVR